MKQKKSSDLDSSEDTEIENDIRKMRENKLIKSKCADTVKLQLKLPHSALQYEFVNDDHLT